MSSNGETAYIAQEKETPPLPAFIRPNVHTPFRRSPRDWLVDIAFFFLALGLSGIAFLLPESDSHLIPFPTPPVHMAVGLLACCALWARRKWPTWLAAVLIILSIFFPAVGGPSVVALFTVAVHRGLPVTIGFTALGLGSGAVQYWLYPLDPDTETNYWVPVGLSGMLTIAVAAWGVVVRTRRQLVVSLQERATRAEAEQQLRVEQGQRRERERIAREMHDALGHRLSLLSVHAGALEFRPDMPAEEISRAAAVIRATAHHCLVDLREILVVLRATDSGNNGQRPQPTLTDIPALLEEAEGAGMEIELHRHLSEPETVPATIGRHGYRIIQESLTNARKHAPAETVRLFIDGEAGKGLTIEIINRLPTHSMGKAVFPSSGIGLAGLTERATLAGGRLEHGRTLSNEFRVWVWLPWPL